MRRISLWDSPEKRGKLLWHNMCELCFCNGNCIELNMVEKRISNVINLLGYED